MSLQHLQWGSFFCAFDRRMTENCFIVRSLSENRTLLSPHHARMGSGQTVRALFPAATQTGELFTGSPGPLCLPSSPALGCTRRRRGTSQISPLLLSNSSFNLSGEPSGAFSIQMRASRKSLILGGVGTEEEGKSPAMLSPSVMKCWDRGEGTNGELSGARPPMQQLQTQTHGPEGCNGRFRLDSEMAATYNYIRPF